MNAQVDAIWTIDPPVPAAIVAGGRQRHQERAACVDGHDAIVELDVALEERAHRRDAGVVDQDVDATESLSVQVDGALDIGVVRDVTFDRQRLRAATASSWRGRRHAGVREIEQREMRRLRRRAPAIARPMPRAAPVTSTVSPAKNVTACETFGRLPRRGDAGRRSSQPRGGNEHRRSLVKATVHHTFDAAFSLSTAPSSSRCV